MIEQNLILVLVLLPFAAAVVAATLPVNAHDAAAWVAGLSMLGGLVVLALLHPAIAGGEVVRAGIRWVPSLGLTLGLRMDGFAWLFAGLVLGIGALVVLYARYYLSPSDPVPRFYSFLMAFAGAMLGVVVSGNIIVLAVFWELTSITSFLLIGYWTQNPAARDGARTSLIVTAGGGVALLAAMLVIGRIAGSYELDRVLAAGEALRAHPWYPAALVLFLLAAFTKSAQFPFHFWLPGAMAAPTPVSAFLHSATMVKAGVFLLVRFEPALGGTAIWFYLVTGTGMATLIVGAVNALFRHDLKGLLAYSTISHLGLITALAGIGSAEAILAAVFHIVNHAIFKASLFMAAGIIDHEAGTRDMRRLSGLFRLMPVTGTLAIVASASMAGVPLLNGFISKEMFFAEAVDWHNGTLLDEALPWLATFAGVFMVAYSLRFIATVFFGPPPVDLPRTPHEPKAWMRRPVELLVLACLLVGVLPERTLGPSLHLALASILGEGARTHDIAVWHGFTTALMMSLVATALGVLLYVAMAQRIAAAPAGLPFLGQMRLQRLYDALILRLTWTTPRSLHRILGTERLQPQISLIVLVALVAAGAGFGVALWQGSGLAAGQAAAQEGGALSTPASPAFALLWLLGGASAIGAAAKAKYHRLAALVLVGGAGLVTCVTYAWLSAPDLAVTQLLVEIVTTVLLLLGLRWLPRRDVEIPGDRTPRARARRGRDLVIAVVAGSALSVLAYRVMTHAPVASIGDWFRRNAWYEGGGTNAVNVILVDFRAFDTFGEVTVLAVVALTVFALLRRFRPAPESVPAPEPQRQPDARGKALGHQLLVPAVLMHWMFPVMIVIAAYFFLRGHDLPGGGFSAGVTLAIALLLQYIASGVRWLETRIIILPIRWMGIGLLFSGVSGLAAWLFGYPFLTTLARYVDLPAIGSVPASTAMAFDLGVFAVVLGATVLMLIAIAHQSLRAVRMREQDEGAPDRVAA